MKEKTFYFLFIHEINSNFKSGKYIFVLTVSLIIASVFAFLQTTDFADRLNNYQHEKTKLDEESNHIKVFSEAQKIFFLKPNPLSIFSKGVDDKVGNKMIISVTDIPELQSESQQRNSFLSIFTGFDTASIITFIISLLVFLTVSNGISEEKEKGTINLIFSNSVSKTGYFLSKYVAYLLLSILPVVILFSCNILFILLNKSINLTLTEYFRVLLMFFASILFVSTITLIGLMASFYCKTTQKSVILNLSIWLMFVFIYPGLIGLFFPDNTIDSRQINSEIEQLKRDFLINSIRLSDELHPRIDENQVSSSGFDEPYLSFLTKSIDVTHKRRYEYIEKVWERTFPQLFSLQYQIITLQKNYRNNLYEKNKRYNNFTFFLPNTSFSKASEKLAGTDLYSRYEYIIQSGTEYRELFLQYLKNRDAFGLKFFTQMPRELMRDDFDAYYSFIDESSDLIYKNYKDISIDDFPELECQHASVFPKELFILLLLNVLLFMAWFFISNSKSNWL